MSNARTPCTPPRRVNEPVSLTDRDIKLEARLRKHVRHPRSCPPSDTPCVQTTTSGVDRSRVSAVHRSCTSPPSTSSPATRYVPRTGLPSAQAPMFYGPHMPESLNASTDILEFSSSNGITLEWDIGAQRFSDPVQLMGAEL
ncbi:hypothetical protein PLICRDRAFT_616700 [Plicaturopsis crispa FD-325 SS-3]|nr:hypothetical protein PLICRDRAFT_616700 [Plicaturopsis crispa FD-325 SS-3]